MSGVSINAHVSLPFSSAGFAPRPYAMSGELYGMPVCLSLMARIVQRRIVVCFCPFAM